jgi:glycosyltransferase involved in cell wall biosynthesis
MPLHKPSFRLIWITQKFPLGTPDGARHATCILIRHLVNLGVKVDMICVLPASEPADVAAAQKYLGVSSCCFVRRTDVGFPFASWRTPLTFRTFVTPDTRKHLHQELTRLLAADQRHRPSVIFDGLHTLAALEPADFHLLPLRCDATVYRAHNFETALWEQCEHKARFPWMRWIYRHQAGLIRDFERQVARSVSWVAPVSQDDAARFRGLAPRARVIPVPIGIDFPDEHQVQPVALHGPQFEILFVGRLDWIPNRTGLSWFLEQVWPHVIRKRPEARLKIAGVGNGHWLQRYLTLPGLQCLGRVAHLENLYRHSQITIAPLFQGSGTRVKILESARFARPVLSTALGAEGTGLVPGVSYLRAETSEEWVQALTTLSAEDCQKIGWNSFMEARKHFEGSAIAESFLQTLHSLHAQHETPAAAAPQPEDFYARTG